MSFSQAQKENIITQQYKSACCRRALLYGILFPKATLAEGVITLSLESEQLCEFLSKLTQEFFSKTLEVSKRIGGGRGKTLSFTSYAYMRYLREISEGGEPFVRKCQYCSQAFLKGIFLSSGRVSDPEKQYSIEFSPKVRVDETREIFSEIGIPLSKTRRGNEDILYTRNSTVIEDFFAASGMNVTAFSLMNEKIEKEIRNNVNRVRNCETNNIDKAVASSLKQITAIEELAEANLISTLPDELQKTAKLRMEYKDLSLSQLAQKSSEAITKSGLTHRLNKIIKIASEIKKNRGEIDSF